ncbi:YcxB family protein [Lysobacter sp. Hz 25]|uniref:YcxB family protein n=1 Tax=Lysobacter sp. Hz 25 TaxID=3383698 RepID=UPI0038D3A0F1
MHSLTLTYDESLLRRAVLGFWWRVVGLRFLIVMALNAIALGVLLLQRDGSWLTGLMATTFALGLGFVVSLYLIHYRNSLRKLRAMRNPQATLAITEAGFSLSADSGSSTLPWSAVAELWKFETCWLLLFSKAQFATLPLSDVPYDAQAFILEHVAAAGGKVS